MKKLETTNKRICKFYHDNPAINFDSVNLIFIDLFDKLLFDANQTMQSSMQSQVFAAITDSAASVSDIKQSILLLKESISTITSENQLAIIHEFNTLKRNYIDDIRQIIQSNTYEKIGPLLEQNNNILVDKTILILNDIIPKTQTHIHTQLQGSLDSFYKSISDDTKTLLKSVDTHSVKEFINNFEIKSSLMLQNVQQPIITSVLASEERINSNIHSMSQQTVINELSDFVSQYKTNRVAKNAHMSTMLTKLYNSADISIQNTNIDSSLILLKRIRKPTIILQSKEIEENVGTDSIVDFMQIIDEKNCNGICISQKSGIATKKNFQIEIHNNNVIVFIHNMDYMPEKIDLAVSIIDNLSSKLHQFSGKSSDDLIISQKNAVIDVFKESQRKVLTQIDEIRFPILDKFLSTKFSAPIQKPGLKCDLCKSFSGNNLKALAAHKRGCIRKQNVSNNLTNSIITGL
jgi:uncharacterized coiled-coil protein SlyX